MPPPEPGSPSEWLRHARSDLILAESVPPTGVLLEALCFHAQQAAEKALKGILVHFGFDPEHTHDIHLLLDEVATLMDLPPQVRAAAPLTDYAVITRYPADLGEIDYAEWQQAVEQARAAVEWAESVIEGRQRQ